MDLIELADELSFADLAEIFARKLLQTEQMVCKSMIESVDLDEEEKDNVREVMGSATNLASQASSAAFEMWFHGGEFVGAVDEALDRVADEYIRTV